MAAKPASPKQINLIIGLLSNKQYPSLGSDAKERIENFNALTEPLTISMASQMIDDLFAAPFDPRPDQPKVEQGIYEVPGEGIFVAKWNRAKTAVYAKRMIEIKADRLNELDEEVKIEFEYAPGAIKLIKPEHKMPLEQATALSIKYGRCIVCGARLKAAKSVGRGMGPVCASYTAG
jgi:Family of unknown function (DUF6011)